MPVKIVALVATKDIGNNMPSHSMTKAFTESTKGKIFLGESAFNKVKSHFGILYGSQFKINGIEFVLDKNLDSEVMTTSDASLAPIFDKLEAKFNPLIK